MLDKTRTIIAVLAATFAVAVAVAPAAQAAPTLGVGTGEVTGGEDRNAAQSAPRPGSAKPVDKSTCAALLREYLQYVKLGYESAMNDNEAGAKYWLAKAAQAKKRAVARGCWAGSLGMAHS